MKIRIGFGLGTRTLAGDADTFGGLVDDLERLRFDSLWLSERISGPAPDPIVAMAVAAGRTERLKFGTSVLVAARPQPGGAGQGAGVARRAVGRPPAARGRARRRRPRRAGRRSGSSDGAGQAVQRDDRDPAPLLDRGPRRPRGRLLPGVGRDRAPEAGAAAARAVAGRPGRLRAAPVRSPRRRLAAVVLRRRRHRRRASRSSSRPPPTPVATIDPEHWGALIAYSHGELPDIVAQVIAKRRPDKAPTDLIPVGLAALRARIEEMVEAGASKFVVLPISRARRTGPPSWRAWPPRCSPSRTEVLGPALDSVGPRLGPIGTSSTSATRACRPAEA